MSWDRPEPRRRASLPSPKINPDTSWHCLESGPGDSAFNMALDEALLEASVRLAHPVLRFYGWTEPAASFGYFQKYILVEQLTPLRPLVRRPTGGGIVPHEADWTYSLVFPPNHEWYLLSARESYCRVHAWIQQAFEQLDLATTLAPESLKAQPGQCFVGHEQCDLLWRGRKIAGAAQRRRKDGLLIQGSIQPPLPSLNRAVWQQAMREVATAAFSARCELAVLNEQVASRALELAQTKYAQAAYNRGR
jgi:lipoate-protein ligase A